MVGDLGELVGRVFNGRRQMVHAAHLDVLGFLAGEAGDVVVVVFITKLVAGGAFDVDGADELFFDELFERPIRRDAIQGCFTAGDEFAGPQGGPGAGKRLKQRQPTGRDAKPVHAQERCRIHGLILGKIVPLDKCNTVAFK